MRLTAFLQHGTTLLGRYRNTATRHHGNTFLGFTAEPQHVLAGYVSAVQIWISTALALVPKIEEKRILAKWKKVGKVENFFHLFICIKKAINLNLLGYREVTKNNIYGTGFAYVNPIVAETLSKIFFVSFNSSGRNAFYRWQQDLSFGDFCPPTLTLPLGGGSCEKIQILEIGSSESLKKFLKKCHFPDFFTASGEGRVGVMLLEIFMQRLGKEESKISQS